MGIVIKREIKIKDQELPCVEVSILEASPEVRRGRGAGLMAPPAYRVA